MTHPQVSAISVYKPGRSRPGDAPQIAESPALLSSTFAVFSGSYEASLLGAMRGISNLYGARDADTSCFMPAEFVTDRETVQDVAARKKPGRRGGANVG